jgi:hypothetical protein
MFSWLNPVAFLYDIRLSNTAIEFVLFRVIRIASVAYTNIDFVEKQANTLRPLSAYRFVNRVGAKYLIHNEKSWFSKYVVVSPSDGESFERALEKAGVVVRK